MVHFLHFVFVRDFWLKLMALVCATVIWFYVDDKLSEERTLPVPLSVQNFQPPDGYMILALDQDKVHVTLRGPKGLLQRQVPQDLIPRAIEVSRDSDGEVSVDLTRRDFLAPKGLSVVDISPDVVTVTLAQIHSRLLRVKPNVVGQAAADYQFIEPATATPDFIKVRGPRKILDERIESIETDPIDISGVNKTINSGGTKIAKFVWLGKTKITVSPDTHEVSVRVQIGPELAVRVVRDVPIRWYTDAKRIGGVKLEPERVNVRVRGPRRELSKLSPESIKIRLDIPDLGVASYEGLIPEVVLPRGFKLAEPEALPSVKATLLPPSPGEAASRTKTNELE